MNEGKLSKKNPIASKIASSENENNSHNSTLKDTEVQNISSYLKDVRLAIIGGGGIAAIELPKLARELRRHGATVQFFVTENCLKFIGLDSLRWASQQEVIIHPTGLAEHICTADAVIIIPATADLISKSANGICSDGATTLIQSALGLKKTIIFCPTMHESLSFSPIIEKNKEKLLKLDAVHFTKPRKEEGKDKLPSVDELSINICHIINRRRFYHTNEKNILITLGGTRAMLDPVRCITNLSTGSLGIEVAKTFYAMGTHPTILAANTNKEIPIFDSENTIHLPDYKDMYEFMKDLKVSKYDAFINLVAGSDFLPRSISHSKISSKDENLKIDFIKAKKIIDLEHLQKIPFKIGAKLTSDSEKEGIQIAKELLTNKNLNAVLYSNSSTTWNKKKEHAGVLITKTNGHISETGVKGKKEMAIQFYASFKKFCDSKAD
ncbi:phosphopantothenoylcysteine decarboxylase [Pigmentibacter sp. JX0631]|uniref:phosphopantothenoylcysteine decarboxylase domain-containing protein n=1 Tax=Pigmentibacter sp. JX0631 TaxID=2976982 RepID=UPI00246873AC|nr:phosphopantothenoylcysteine decarboxylase [Pigmentibacter sp. JX0631]WGL58740.1 phosphopantothenoylcysteine decarboxylase [Pigmentibacter sp. JX0631]